ncbi:hypothetical protein LEP1GSC202_0370 [Leptospira yanagawae serovar Saopaulo str. Sao Paulo = ATCC 700523]|uniref:Integrase core domain protein n=1 Tax=Leptospira yanagawae serovar Saopaulo str. Sao Paulo = ATCC 700523 TaxID=1249483 RepID=A0A5E8HHJ8_9LEPT|nr:hypothetical protein LEP1GSC202_0370 [Leptospira yanagawae serovar Saopaulo str. Sao Paulo = ATCC 700523]
MHHHTRGVPLPKNSNEVWSMDFVFERTIDGRKQRILTGIDHLTRENTILQAVVLLFVRKVDQIFKHPRKTSKSYLFWIMEQNLHPKLPEMGRR